MLLSNHDCICYGLCLLDYTAWRIPSPPRKGTSHGPYIGDRSGNLRSGIAVFVSCYCVRRVVHYSAKGRFVLARVYTTHSRSPANNEWNCHASRLYPNGMHSRVLNMNATGHGRQTSVAKCSYSFSLLNRFINDPTICPGSTIILPYVIINRQAFFDGKSTVRDCITSP